MTPDVLDCAHRGCNNGRAKVSGKATDDGMEGGRDVCFVMPREQKVSCGLGDSSPDDSSISAVVS